MEFEEMKKIWDTQNNQPMFAIDEKTLHKRVKRKTEAINRSVNLMEFGIIAITLGMGTYLLIDGIIDGEAWTRYYTSAIAFLVAIYMFAGRIRRDYTRVTLECSGILCCLCYRQGSCCYGRGVGYGRRGPVEFRSPVVEGIPAKKPNQPVALITRSRNGWMANR